ncbi:hypothetical protein HRbin11_00949 [bacterium HR11]|nr:hypothetical protein HRbin11_00949 [bacterium HR11]
MQTRLWSLLLPLFLSGFPLAAQEVELVPVAGGPAVAWMREPFTGMDFTPQAVALVRYLPSGPIAQVFDLTTGAVSDFIRPAPILERGAPVLRWGRDGRRYLGYRDGSRFRILQGDARGERLADVEVGVAVLDFDVDEAGHIYVIGPGLRQDDTADKLVHAFRGSTRLWSAGAAEEFGLSSGRGMHLGPRDWYHVWVRGDRIYAVAKDRWAVFSSEGEVLARGRFLLSSPDHGAGAVDFMPGIGWLVVEREFAGVPGVFPVPPSRLLLYDDQGRRVGEWPTPGTVLRLRDGQALVRMPDGWRVMQVRWRLRLAQ